MDDDIVTEQPIINEEEGIVTFKVSDAAVDDDLSGMIPTIVVSSKAKITPASGVVAQDFSNGKRWNILSLLKMVQLKNIQFL